MNKFYFFCISLLVSLIPVFGQNKSVTPFKFGIYNLEKDTPVSASFLNKPITEKDRISVSSDGHLQAAGKRLRIYGTNLSEFPTKSNAAYCAQILANQGYNCIRFHHTDADWTECFIKRLEDGTRILNKTKLDDFDYFFAELKKAGIYSNINLLTGRSLNSKDKGFLKEINNFSEMKSKHALGFWNKPARDYQKEWARTLLDHVNPYTGIAYKDDPAVCIVEINNENGLMMAYQTGWLEEVKGQYWQELEDQFNQWLIKNNYSYDSLAKQFNKSLPQGKNIIDESSRFNMESYEGAKTELSVNNNEHIIRILENGKLNWHIQYSCPKLSFESSKIYTISFELKASKEQNIDFSLMENHAPWQNAGWSTKIKAEKNYKKYTFTVDNITTDSNLRFTAGGMGLLKGTTVYLKNVQIQEGGDFINVHTGKRSKESQKTVLLPHFAEYTQVPDAFKNIIMTFLYETELSYWTDMKNFLKEEIKTPALLMGTIIGCSSYNIQNIFDIIDSHGYWNHPVFPVDDWNMNQYYVENNSLLKAADGGILTALAYKRVYGKPFSVTEYDHPYPNQYCSEDYPMLAAYASYQDWDCIYTFCSNLPKSQNPVSEKIYSYFDQTSNPVKACAAPFAARIFRNFMVKSESQPLYYELSEKEEKSKLYTFSGWNISEAGSFNIDKTLGFTNPLGIVLDGKKPANGINAATYKKDDSKKSLHISSNQQLLWDTNKGIFAVCTPELLITASFSNDKLNPEDIPANWKQLFPLSPFEAESFSSVVSIKENNHFIVYGSSWTGNSGEQLSLYENGNKKALKDIQYRGTGKMTTAPTLGRGPSVCLSANGYFSSVSDKTYTLFPLSIKGKKIEDKKQTGTRLKLTADSGSLWYIIEENN